MLSLNRLIAREGATVVKVQVTWEGNSCFFSMEGEELWIPFILVWFHGAGPHEAVAQVILIFVSIYIWSVRNSSGHSQSLFKEKNRNRL